MRFTKTLLLAALASTSLARHGHHVHHEDHARRQVGSTTTITTTETVVYCPCDSSTSTVTPVMPSPSPSSSVEVTPTSIPSTTSTSTSTETPTESTTTTTTIPTSSSSTFTTLPSTTTSSTSTTTTTTTSSSSSSSSSTSTTPSTNTDWTTTPSNNEYSTTGFGGTTNSTGSGVSYTGNVGNPYGSNIIEVSAATANAYQYVVQFSGSNTEDWTIAIWNKIGPDGKMDGWYNNACHTFTLSPGAVKYYAFDSDSQGGWAAASGSSIPTDSYGGYAATWGEFDFGSSINSGWSGFDVSAIQAQAAGLEVQGMRICSVLSDGTCSVVSAGAGSVRNAYIKALATVDGIGGNLVPGAVRLAVEVDYRG